jgi:hypothetical protein
MSGWEALKPESLTITSSNPTNGSSGDHIQARRSQPQSITAEQSALLDTIIFFHYSTRFHQSLPRFDRTAIQRRDDDKLPASNLLIQPPQSLLPTVQSSMEASNFRSTRTITTALMTSRMHICAFQACCRGSMVKRNPLGDGNKAFPSVKSIIQVDSVTIRKYSMRLN